MGYNHHSTITKVEAGRVDIPLSRLAQFAEILGVSEAYLMGWTDEQNTRTVDTQSETASSFETEFAEMFSLPSEMQGIKILIKNQHDRRIDYFIKLDNMSLSESELSEICDYAEYLISKRK